MPLDNIKQVKQMLAACVQWLQENKYIDKSEANRQMQNIQDDGVVSIPLYNKPDPTCPVCEAIHGEYKNMDHALDILSGHNRDECKKAARRWLQERIDTETDTETGKQEAR